MLKFDSSNLSLEIVMLKSATTAGGGSITVIDTENSTPAKEVLRRIPVPMGVVRRFLVVTHKFTKYIKAVPVGVIRYKDLVILMERHPLAALANVDADQASEGKSWVPSSWLRLHAKVLPSINSCTFDWYFDGRYVYRMQSSDLGVALRTSTFLSSDGLFRRVVVQCYDLQMLDHEDSVEMSERTCLAYITPGGQAALTPPIWKDIAAIGKARDAAESDDDDGEEDEDGTSSSGAQRIDTFFDTIDDLLAVNVNFVLKAGTMIGQTFGYEYAEPLQLPRLMIELHTVNLPNLPQEIKTSYDVSIKFTHAMAWLLGLARRVDTLETAVMMRSLMKYLSNKGSFVRNAYFTQNVFVDGASVNDVQSVSYQELSQSYRDRIEEIGIGGLIEEMRDRITTQKIRAQQAHVLGEMITED